MFPERQHGPHREWTAEVEFLDKMFDNGAAYTVGKVNGDHWLLYMTSPPAEGDEPMDSEAEGNDDAQTNGNGSIKPPLSSSPPDYTIEILMSKLSAPARRPFFFPSSDPSPSHAKDLSSDLGLASLFPADLTTLDPYAFEPCGYSANALVDCGGGEGYYTIHVTPEEGWSYASFECNVPMSTTPSPNTKIPDLETLIQRVIHIFQPGHLTLTLFISSSDEETATIDAAQKVFSKALGPGGYSRTNKINYEFGGYDLAFASFEKNGKRVHAHA
jgi:S-adenosylmethionine decarboxylase